MLICRDAWSAQVCTILHPGSYKTIEKTLPRQVNSSHEITITQKRNKYKISASSHAQLSQNGGRLVHVGPHSWCETLNSQKVGFWLSPIHQHNAGSNERLRASEIEWRCQHAPSSCIALLHSLQSRISPQEKKPGPVPGLDTLSMDFTHGNISIKFCKGVCCKPRCVR